MNKGYKISYSQGLLRVRLSLTLGHAATVEEFPEGFVDKAKAQLEKDQETLMCKYIKTYEENCKEVWKNIKKKLATEDYDTNEVVHIDLAAGCPHLNGFNVKINPKGEAEISTSEDPQSISEWPLFWFQIWLEESLKELGFQKRLHQGMVTSLWRSLRIGEKVEKYCILESPKTTDKPFVIAGNKDKGECYLQINNPEYLQSNSTLNEMIRASAKAIKQISESGNGPYKFHKEFLVEMLSYYAHSTEKYGANFPLLVFMGSGQPITKPISKGADPSKASGEAAAAAGSSDGGEESSAAEKNYPGRGLLKIEFSDDNMECWIQDWDLDNYELPDVKYDRTWLNEELERYKIKFGMSEKIKGEVINTLRKKEDIQGIVIAQGKVGEPASNPYLYPVYKDVKPEVTDGDTINIRDFQERTIVDEGELVALLKYENEMVKSCDVFGKEFEPEDAEKVEIVKGDGVVEKKYGEYYAKYAGMPIIEDKTISVSKMLVHEGDVNLRSGNLRFDGPVEIKGSIDAGCVVECSDNLVVRGSVRGGQILVGGDMQVVHGVITTKEGTIRCKGTLTCEFIENSRVIASKNIVVKKVILNSEVFCGGSIIADEKQGRITGGRLCVDNMIECAAMGSEQGVRTEVDVGRDWRSEFAIGIRKNRHEYLKDLQTELKKELNTLKSRSKAQLTKKHEAKKEELQTRVNKLSELVPRAKDHLQSAKDSIELNSRAKIIVHDLLSMGCIIRVAEAKVRLKQAVMGVKINNKKKKGTYIHAIDDAELDLIRIEREALLRGEPIPEESEAKSATDDKAADESKNAEESAEASDAEENNSQDSDANEQAAS